jgi:hypothetical protein
LSPTQDTQPTSNLLLFSKPSQNRIERQSDFPY